MTYTLINLGFLIPASIFLAILASKRRGPHWPALLGTGVALVVLTVVFDNLMIAAGLFYYDEKHTSGIRLGLMPIEDLAYIVFAVLVLPALWTALSKEAPRERQ